MSGTSGAGSIDNAATGVTNATLISQSVNQTSGFSITKFDGHASGITLPHNLGATPAFILVKRLDAGDNWYIWHQNLSTTHIYFNNGGQATDAASFGTINSTIWTSGATDGTGGHGGAYVCYAWKAVSGVSAFGTYTGTGGALTVTYTDSNSFTARFIMVKKLTTGNWMMMDGFRDSGVEWTRRIRANSDVAETSETTIGLTPTSTGFTFDSGTTDGDVNSSGGVYIYCAFAVSYTHLRAHET